jgi:hypothetical protein
MCKEYNGWVNYETWNMNLWLTNDSGFYEVANETIKDIVESESSYEGYSNIDKNDLTYKVSSWLEEYANAMWMEDFSSCNFNHSYGPLGDIATAAWNEIQWHDIAEHLVNDWLEENKEEVENAVLG